jgi:hypothetical protein|tara:strand:- start:2552 stop:2974 length:423 start_codon:yes stop_codon:yes gene_type:complete
MLRFARDMEKKELIRELDYLFSDDTELPLVRDFLNAAYGHALEVIHTGGEWTEEKRRGAIMMLNAKDSPVKVLNLAAFNKSPDKQIREGMLLGRRDELFENRFAHFGYMLDLLRQADVKLSRSENDYNGIKRLIIDPIHG